MKTVSRGDVVLVDYPYTDRTGSKVRPCIVVQNDASNQQLDDTIVVLMTSRTRFTPGSSTELLITAQSPAGRQAGLIFDSAVQGQNLLTRFDRCSLLPWHRWGLRSDRRLAPQSTGSCIHASFTSHRVEFLLPKIPRNYRTVPGEPP